MLSYEDVACCISYDPETGIFERFASTWNCKTILGPIKGKSKSITVKGQVIVKNHMAYLLMTGEPPPGYMYHIDEIQENYKWGNLALRAVKSKNSRKELINGQWREVDGTTTPPKTDADKKRRAGECKGCRWYQKRCIMHDMELECIGPDYEEPKEIQNNYQAIRYSL